MTNQPIFEILRAEVARTQDEYTQSKQRFWRICGEAPGEPPQLDARQRLTLAARAQTIAMIAYTNALHRFNEFLLSGKVPADLQSESGLVPQATGFNQEQRRRMDRCVYCGTPTRMYEDDSPICIDCASCLDAGERLTRRESARDEGSIGEKVKSAAS